LSKRSYSVFTQFVDRIDNDTVFKLAVEFAASITGQSASDDMLAGSSDMYNVYYAFFDVDKNGIT